MADITTTSTTCASGAAPISAKPSTSKKAVKPRKPTLPAEHPKYREMIAEAILSLKERRGSSRQAILKYIVAHFKVGTEMGKINGRIKQALRTGIKNGNLRQVKGSGASGSFRLGEKVKPTKSAKTTKKPKPAVKKPASKKSKTAVKKSASTKKVGAKKVKSVGKLKKSPAKTAAKKTLKTKSAKSPARKIAKKTTKPKKMLKKSPAKKSGKAKAPKK